MHYYERIRELRQDRDKTQTEIAEYLQIDQSYYSKYERGLDDSITQMPKTREKRSYVCNKKQNVQT